MKNRNCSTNTTPQAPSLYWLDPEDFDLEGHPPTRLDRGITQVLVVRLTRKLHRLRRRSSLHTRSETVDAAIEIIERELPRLAKDLAQDAGKLRLLKGGGR